jgi:hypothetical protein
MWRTLINNWNWLNGLIDSTKARVCIPCYKDLQQLNASIARASLLPDQSDDDSANVSVADDNENVSQPSSCLQASRQKDHSPHNGGLFPLVLFCFCGFFSHCRRCILTVVFSMKQLGVYERGHPCRGLNLDRQHANPPLWPLGGIAVPYFPLDLPSRAE